MSDHKVTAATETAETRTQLLPSLRRVHGASPAHSDSWWRVVSERIRRVHEPGLRRAIRRNALTAPDLLIGVKRTIATNEIVPLPKDEPEQHGEKAERAVASYEEVGPP